MGVEANSYKFKCALKVGEGICGASFMTHKALIMHMVHTNKDSHGIRQYARFITRTNQCVHCRSVFNSREAAQNHAVEAERKGACPTSRSKKEDGLVKITDMQCVIWQHECRTIMTCRFIWLNIVCHRLAHIRSQSIDMEVWMIPEASKGKRPASQTLGQARKAQAGKGGGKGETQSVGSMESGAPAAAQLSQSLNAFMKSPGQSQIEELESMGVMEYMLMLLLQTSRRLADLESNITAAGAVDREFFYI